MNSASNYKAVVVMIHGWAQNAHVMKVKTRKLEKCVLAGAIRIRNFLFNIVQYSSELQLLYFQLIQKTEQCRIQVCLR